MSAQFAVGHHLSMGGSNEDEQKGSYNITTDFIQDPFLAMHARFDPSTKKLFSHFSFTKKPLSVQIQTQVDDPETSAYSIDLGYRWASRYLQMKFTRNGGFGFSYLQSITKNLSIGADNFLITGQAMSICSLGGKYKLSEKSYTALHVTPATLSGTLVYVNKPHNQLAFASELAVANTQRGLQTIGTFSSLITGQAQQIKTSINSRGCLSSLVTTDFGFEIPLILNLAFELDYLKKDFKLGYGLSLQF